MTFYLFFLSLFFYLLKIHAAQSQLTVPSDEHVSNIISRVGELSIVNEPLQLEKLAVMGSEQLMETMRDTLVKVYHHIDSLESDFKQIHIV